MIVIAITVVTTVVMWTRSNDKEKGSSADLESREVAFTTIHIFSIVFVTWRGRPYNNDNDVSLKVRAVKKTN